jgi:putative Mn2+ efflux pump MntP
VLAVVLFAIAVSVDGFLVGIAQGMRGIKVPVATLIVINVVSGVVVFLSLSTGDYVANRLGLQAAKVIGSGILIVLGTVMLKPLSGSRRRNSVSCNMSGTDINKRDVTGAFETTETSPSSSLNTSNTGSNTGESMGESAAVDMIATETVISKITKTLIMIPKFLAEPVTADLDLSGTLTIDEGFFLGLALAIDALGVGFGAGMAGMSSNLTPVVAGITQGIFVSLGLILGRKMRKTVPSYILEKAPGGILILLGAMRLK